MSSTQTATGTAPDNRARPDQRDYAVTALDMLALGSVVVVALVAWASLALADLGAYSLAAVIALTAMGIAVVLVVLLRRTPRPRADRGGLVIALGCAVVAAIMSFPGFSYGVADKDPGVYVSHAIEISRQHDYAFTDPLLATRGKDPTFPVALTSLGARFPGVWVDDDSTGRMVPQFYHLWPALMATAYSAFGLPGLRDTAPFVGVVSVLVMCALLRRLGNAMAGPTAGLLASGAGGLLLATNMLQVWQSRFPSTEILAQALYLGSLLGIVVAVRTRWWPAAAAAGLVTGIGWLNRPDALLLVIIAAGAGALLIGLARWDARCLAFALGLLVVAPHALVQAYDLCRIYTLSNGIPGLSHLLLGVTCLAVVAVAVRLVLHGPVDSLQQALERRQLQVAVGVLVVLGAASLMVLGFLRPRLFGPTYAPYGDRVIRTYDEQILRRLSWFFTLPGLAVMQLGIAVVALRRWCASLWVVLLPSLMLFVLYGYTAKNSTRLLWWSRRYIPTVLPGVLILMALALAYFMVVRLRGRALLRLPAVAVLVALLAVFFSQSLPLRAHDEWQGSFEVSARIAALAGDQQGIFVWDADQTCCANITSLFATPVWLQHGQVSALLPDNATFAHDPASRRTVLARYAQRFPHQPLFVIADRGGLPAGIDATTVTLAATITATLPFWQESDAERPHVEQKLPITVSVWRVTR